MLDFVIFGDKFLVLFSGYLVYFSIVFGIAKALALIESESKR